MISLSPEFLNLNFAMLKTLFLGLKSGPVHIYSGLGILNSLSVLNLKSLIGFENGWKKGWILTRMGLTFDRVFPIWYNLLHRVLYPSP